MKERILYEDQFEKQLKEKSDQFKMYPSDKVWNEVHRSLHTRRKRFIAGMTFLIGGILILAGSQLISPSKNIVNHQVVPKTTPQLKAPSVLNLHAFNSNAANGEGENHEQNLRTPFYAGLQSEENYSGLSSSSTEEQSLVVVKSDLMKTGGPNRQENINLSGVVAGNTSALNLNEKEEQGQQNFPAMTAVSDVNPDAEKATGRNTNIRNDRFSWEIYISPTLNTHHLDGVNYQNINPTIQSAPITVVRFANVNGFVDNTPAMGYDLGGNILYRISSNLSLKAGLQFSFSRYYFKAYNSNRSQSSAALSSYFGYIADSLVNYSLAPGTDPKSPQRFQNKYYSLSMPVGMELKVAGKGRLQLFVGATVQTSYLLNRNAYVLSGDYNSYSKNPEVFRKWNVHAGAEAFISYRVGKIRWELGPQVRYQILSSYYNSYPFKENLMNYGLRLGFSKSIR